MEALETLEKAEKELKELLGSMPDLICIAALSDKDRVANALAFTQDALVELCMIFKER